MTAPRPEPPWLLLYFPDVPIYRVSHGMNYLKWKDRADVQIMGHILGKDKAFGVAKELNDEIRRRKGKGGSLILPPH